MRLLPPLWRSLPSKTRTVSSYRFLTNRAEATCIPSDAISDETISTLASRPLHPLTLSDLVKHGLPPLSPANLFASANFSLSILPARLAHRIQALRNLPFIVVTNPHIAQIHNNYMHSLTTLLPFAEKDISTIQDENFFTEIMAGLVQTHTNTIPVLARGFLETGRYINSDAVTQFLDQHLRARIGTRLIAEQHIALHYSSQSPEQSPQTGSSAIPVDNSYIGIIDTALKPSSIVESCESFVSEICELNYGVRPSLVINGEPETRIAHIPVHLEYIITELLKNSFRAIIEAGTEREPIEVTIAPSPEESSSTKQEQITMSEQGNADAPSASMKPLESATPGVTIRIRDRGGGISPENYASLWQYGFTTFDDQEAIESRKNGTEALTVISASGGNTSSLAGLGYGLPLARAYAEYFGGGIAVQSLWGYGTDVYLSLRGVGKVT